MFVSNDKDIIFISKSIVYYKIGKIKAGVKNSGGGYTRCTVALKKRL